MSVEIEALSVHRSGRPLVEAASLSLAPGEVLALIGPNGAGKSTLLRAAAGLIPRSGGRISVSGSPLEALDGRERARRIAYLPQERRIEWDISVKEVVALGRLPHAPPFGAEAEDPVVSRIMDLCGIGGLRGRSALSLSGGEAARVLLARALAAEAPFLFADEPIAQLDPFHQLQVMEILRACAGAGSGVLIVLHDLVLAARFADRIAVMAGGRIVVAGSPADALRAEVLEAVYGVRFFCSEYEGAALHIPWRRLEGPLRR